MELVDGITLKQYMQKKGALSWKETLHFSIQIAKALAHAHAERTNPVLSAFFSCRG